MTTLKQLHDELDEARREVCATVMLALNYADLNTQREGLTRAYQDYAAALDALIAAMEREVNDDD